MYFIYSFCQSLSRSPGTSCGRKNLSQWRIARTPSRIEPAAFHFVTVLQPAGHHWSDSAVVGRCRDECRIPVLESSRAPMKDKGTLHNAIRTNIKHCADIALTAELHSTKHIVSRVNQNSLISRLNNPRPRAVPHIRYCIMSPAPFLFIYLRWLILFTFLFTNTF